MRRPFTVPSLLFVFTSAASAQAPRSGPLHEGAPESVGFSSERLDRIDERINDWIQTGKVNGAVGLVIRNGTIVYYKALGYNDVDAKTALAKDGIFRIASQSKAITTVAAMMLYEEGKFLLDEPVSKYIPSFANEKVVKTFRKADNSYTTVPAKRQVTIRDLMSHQAGISYPLWGTPANPIYTKHGVLIGHTFGYDLGGERVGDVMTRLGALPLMNQPGEKFTYGFGVDVLGALVEIWSGMTLDEFFRRRIFEPLGMRDTYFNVPIDKARRLVNFYQVDSLGHPSMQAVLRFPRSTDTLPLDYPLRQKVYFSGGGGLSSTIYDYAVFLQMVLNGGEYNGTRLLSRNTIRMMTTNQIGALDIPQGKFGLGFSVVPEENAGRYPSRAGTYGWGGALSTVYWVDPAERLILLLYRQMWGSTKLDFDNLFRVQVYQALIE